MVSSDLIKLQGYSSVIGGLDDVLDGWTTNESMVVGTPAEYAIFVHEGTSRMEGRPFLKDAIEEVVAEKGDEMAEKASSGDELVLMIGLELAGTTRDKITEYGAVDTTYMRDSTDAVRL